MPTTYKLGKTCKTCGKKLSDLNKSGFCNIHRDRTGANNPFFGKHHSKETLDKAKEKCRAASIKKWEDPEYRARVINGTTGKTRSEDFKETQRQNALAQMQNEQQRILRSKAMKESWKNGKISFHENHTPNFSKDEKLFGSILRERLGDNAKYLDDKFKVERDDLPKHYYCPDFRYKNYIIEFDGDFWHAHNIEDNEIVHHNITAKEIRDNDSKKTRLYEKNGFIVIRVWQSDFLSNKDDCINKVLSIIL